jgi:rod shape-determining protein MreC
MAMTGWRLSRGRGPSAGHISLALCGIAALGIVLVGKAEPTLFNDIRAKVSDWTAPILEGVREPLSGVQRWVENLGSFFTVYDENIRLKREVAELRKWQEVATSLQRRLERYEILLKAVPDTELPTIQARVIGQSSRPFIKTMILNAGSAQGVKPGQAVVDDRGLIGRVYLTGTRTSWVILLSDLDSRVPVAIEPSNRRAILSGDNSTAPALELDTAVPVMPKAGDRVYSSGDGGQLPPGLPVGVVVGEGADLRVALFADPDATDFVHVVEYQVPAPPPPSAALPEMPVTPLPAPAPAPPPAGALPAGAPAGTTPGARAAPPTPPSASPSRATATGVARPPARSAPAQTEELDR